MTPRAVFASAALHIVVVAVLLVLVSAATPARPPATVDIEIVTPMLAVVTPAPPPPPPVDRGRDGGQRGDRIADRAPGRRAQPLRNLPQAHRAAPPPPSPAAVTPSAPDLPAAEPAGATNSEAVSGEPAAGDDPQSGGGAGQGTGGSGSGAGAVDLSARPVPLDLNSLQTLMYTAEAQRDRVSGDVHLVLTIDPLGHVGRATLRRGLGHGLDEIAIKRAMQLRFVPAKDRAGNPTVGTVTWGFHFEPP